MDGNFGREALQARIVGEMFRDAVRGQLAIKGGMAMRAAYGSVRFTRDIDVAADAERMSPERVKASIGAAIRSALRKAPFVSEAVVTTPKMTDTTQRWKISGVIGGSAFNLTVECSRRAALPSDAFRQVEWKASEKDDPVVLDVYRIDLMSASKISCLCNPTRDAPRDVYDLGILMSMTLDPPIGLIRRIGKDALRRGLSALWDKMDAMDWRRAQSELLPFLPEGVRSVLDERLWDETRMKVGEKVEEWLKAALEDGETSAPEPAMAMRP